MSDLPEKIETVIPNFPGFYGSVFDNYIDSTMLRDEFVYRFENDFDDDELWDKVYDKVWDNFDMQEYMRQVGLAYLAHFEYEMTQSFNFPSLKLEYVGIESPREYNFKNDELVVNILNVNQAFVDFLTQVLRNNRDYVAPILKERFSSYSGFHSFMEPEFEDWLAELQTFDHRYIINSIYILMEKENQNIDEDCIDSVRDHYCETDPIYFVDFDKIGKELNLIERKNP